MSGFSDITIASFLGSGIASVIVGAILATLFAKRNERVKAAVQAQFTQTLKVFESQRSWKQQVLFEVLAQFAWNSNDHLVHFSTGANATSKVVREGNQKIRDILLAH